MLDENNYYQKEEYGVIPTPYSPNNIIRMKLKLLFVPIILLLIASCEKNNEQNYPFLLNNYYEIMLGDTLKLLIDNQKNYQIYTDDDAVIDFYKQDDSVCLIGKKEGNAKFYVIKSSTERDTILINVISPYFVISFEDLDEINNLGLQQIPNPTFVVVANFKRNCYILGYTDSKFSYIDTPFYMGTYSISLDGESISMDLIGDNDSLKYMFQLYSIQVIEFLKEMPNIEDKPCYSFSVKMKDLMTDKEVNHALFSFKYDKIPYGIIQQN